MKTTTQSLTAVLLTVALAGSAFANGPRGHYPHNQHRGHHARHHDSNWVAPLLFLGLAGAVIGAAASQQPSPPPPPVSYIPPPVTYVQPAPVYVAPPVTVAPPPPQPAPAWYFCRSVGQYYPYAQSCPEGWQQVAPTPPQ
jgi:hypothetical protein